MRTSNHIIVVSIWILLLALESCSNHDGTDRAMRQIDDLTRAQPATALQLLDNMAPEVKSMAKDAQMQYYLLRTKARLKSTLSIKGDTVIEKVARYYESNGTNYQRMDAYYLLGNYHIQRGDAPQAIQSYLKAVQYADSNANPRDLMLIHGRMQDLYERLYLRREALEEMQLATHFAMKAKDTASALIYQEGPMWWYTADGDYDRAAIAAKRLYEQRKRWKPDDKNSLVLSYCVLAHLKRGQWQQAKRYLDIYETNFHDKNIDTHDLSFYLYDFKAKYYIGIGKQDSALYFQQKLGRADSTYGCKVKLYSNYLSLYYKIGNADSVYKYAKLYSSYNDSTMMHLNTERVGQIRSMYDYSAQQQEAYRLQMEKDLIMAWAGIGAVSAMAGLSWLVHVLRRNKRKEREAAQAQAEQYDQLIERYRQVCKQYDLVKHEDSEKTRLNSLLQESIEQLRRQMAELHPCKTAPDDRVLRNPIVQKMHHIAKTGQKPLDEDWNSLYSAIGSVDAGFVTWLDSHKQQMSRNEQRLCILTRLRFIPSEMAILLVTSRSNISNMRTRLRQRLFGQEPGNANFDILIGNV